jgi:hypothetical protein
MIDSLIYCVGNEVFIYLVVDLPQASTFNKWWLVSPSNAFSRCRIAVTAEVSYGVSEVHGLLE